MFRAAPSRDTHHQPTPERVESNGSTKANNAAASNSMGDIEACMICMQNYIEYSASIVYDKTHFMFVFVG